MQQPGLGHTFSSFPPSLAIPPMAPVEAAVQKPTPVGFSLFSLHAVAVESDCHCCVGQWESPPTVVVLRDVIRAETAAGGFGAEAFSSSGLAHVPVPKGGLGVLVVFSWRLSLAGQRRCRLGVPSRGWQLWLLSASPSLCCCAQFLVHVWSPLFFFSFLKNLFCDVTLC